MSGVMVLICCAGYVLLVVGLIVIFGGGADLGDRMLGAAFRSWDERQWSRDEDRAYDRLVRAPDFVPEEWEREFHA